MSDPNDHGGPPPSDYGDPYGDVVEGAFVRLHVVARGRELPAVGGLALVTLVSVTEGAGPERPTPELHAVWELLRDGYLSVAEVAGHLGMPVGVTRLLLEDLAEQGLLLRREPPAPARKTDPALLKEVLHGLRQRIG